jgi:hypothetical protein
VGDLAMSSETIYLCVVSEEYFKDGEQWTRCLGEYWGGDSFEAMRRAVKGLEKDLIGPIDERPIIFEVRQEAADYLGIELKSA